jgi:formylglycine-generating enzyme required for sulfatase activity
MPKRSLNTFTSAMTLLVAGLVLLTVSGGLLTAENPDNGDIPVNTVDSARRVITDLIDEYGAEYQGGQEYLSQLDSIESILNDKDAENRDDALAALQALIREATLANPILDFNQIMVIRRNGEANRNLNSHTTDTIKRNGWNNEISLLTNLRGELNVHTLHKPDGTVLKHMELHFDGDRAMFSGVNQHGNWAIFELDLATSEITELTPDDQHDVQWFDACYLPEDGSIISCSTAGMQGLPCENGGRPMTNLYKVDTETKDVRQLTFEQDSDWHPRVLENGRVLYLRWEYTDTPHYYSRYLFHMNPDGTGQMEFWGSGSYFPTAYCWPRQIPENPSMLIGTVSGHHAKSETGRLMIIDRSLSRKYPFRITPESREWGPEGSEISINTEVLPAEETGCVQEIPGWGRDVVGNVYDNQGGNQTYTFGSPYPLSDKYFLVSMQGCPGAKNKGKWSIALVDIFDNMTLIHEDAEYGHAFEPIPLKTQITPPVLVDRTFEDAPSTIFCTNVYDGRGLVGVPEGAVKSLRIFSYHYGYIRSGGHESCGLESGWDIKRILGTVPVEEDGSFWFEAPANTPLAIQPLDEDGAALALMRSWMVGMPGETVSCNGCHEELNEATPARNVSAARRAPSPIEPWYGPARPFAFPVEVQPVLNEYCIGCHNEDKLAEKGRLSFEQNDPNNWRADRAYLNLSAYVRRWGPESDLDMYDAMEWHVSTSPIVQMLRKGHKGVELDDEAWDRLITWIDLNVPHRGMWNNETYEVRRLELADLYAGLTDNPEEEYRQAFATSLETSALIEPIMPPKQPQIEPDGLHVLGFPFVTIRETPLDVRDVRKIQLNSDVDLQLVRVRAGKFVMGSQAGFADEAPRAVISIANEFWMGETEITNAQYNVFDPIHDTRYQDEDGKDHAVPGYIANHPDQPVSRISWQEATSFCEWLSEQTGRTVTLPTESQWEWAARAGSENQFFYGDRDTDFSTYANLADRERRRTYVKWDGGSKVHIRRDYPENYLYPLRDDRFTDNWFTVDYVAQCTPNSFGLYDMVGNVSEWTRSSYQAYPYNDADGRNDAPLTEQRVARGGSWNDRPQNAGSSIRLPYESHQKVFDVGFRVVIE